MPSISLLRLLYSCQVLFLCPSRQAWITALLPLFPGCPWAPWVASSQLHHGELESHQKCLKIDPDKQQHGNNVDGCGTWVKRIPKWPFKSVSLSPFGHKSALSHWWCLFNTILFSAGVSEAADNMKCKRCCYCAAAWEVWKEATTVTTWSWLQLVWMLSWWRLTVVPDSLGNSVQWALKRNAFNFNSFSFLSW